MLRFGRFVFPGFFVCWILGSCASEPASLRILSYNTQNLFDGIHQGGEYPEFDPQQSEWNSKAYWHRLKRLATAIRSVGNPLPEVIILLEIENRAVLDDLIRQEFPTAGYTAFFASVPGQKPGVGLLSRVTVRSARLIGVAARGHNARPMIEARLGVGPTDLTIIAAHWKSRRGAKPGDASDLLRQAAAYAANARLLELAKTDPGLPVVLMGDLNEGLLPLEEDLIKPLAGKSLAWQSTWRLSRVPGSFWYRGEWEAIDHALVHGCSEPSPWAVLDFQAIANQQTADRDGHPWRYDSRRKSGLSDHLPILLTLGAKDRLPSGPSRPSPTSSGWPGGWQGSGGESLQ